MALVAAVVVLAILGLTPQLSWIPELPLLSAAVVLPVVAFGLAGYRAASRSGRFIAGALAGAVTGVLGGTVGGLSYVLFGKSFLNVALGIALGGATGAVVGLAAAVLSGRRAVDL